MSPGDLAKALGCLKIPTNPNVLAGVNSDAGVYRVRPDLAIVETVDLIAAIVDDPYSFGQIAAANGISDIYAMGAKPITAMNIVAFPSDTMDINILGQILRGALDKLTEAGIVLVGGHSVRNDEVRFGLSVTGIIDPAKVITKHMGQVGDHLIITKPLGTGILNTALKAGMLPEPVRHRVTAQMVRLNDKACQAMLKVGAHACTDVTGFGLLGHLAEMVEDKGYSVELNARAVPVLPEAREYAHMGLLPEGMYANWEYREPMVEVGETDEDTMSILYDPQTSGGLLMAVAPEKANPMLAELSTLGVPGSADIGRIVASDITRIKVL